MTVLAYKTPQCLPTQTENSEVVLPFVLGDIELSKGESISCKLGNKLVEVLAQRAEVGRQKYDTYLTTHNGRDCIRDFIEELFDALFYIRQAQMENCVSMEEYTKIHTKILEIFSILEF